MFKRSLRQWWLLACFAIAVGFVAAAPSSAARKPRAVYLDLHDTGKTVALSVGEQLVVKLPLKRRRDDDTWYVASNSGGGVRLVAGPDEKRPPNWTPFRPSQQLFYFQRESPGTTDLVLEQRYFSKPMTIKVVDR